jgi:phosphoglycolate phosphatase-like HAD superfamily hydrolase
MNILNGVRAVIFDCDGVMFDSREANAAYYNHLLSRFNLSQLGEEELDFVHMHTNRESIVYIFSRRGGEGRRYLPEVLESLQGIDYSAFLGHMKIELHLKEILGYLRPLYRTAISTNRTTTMPLILERFGLVSCFDLVITALNVEHPKPHPESLWKILGTFKLEPHEAVYVGDSLIDQMAAQDADITLVAYCNPMLKAAYHIQSLLELKDILP